jgi:outer membrane protein OmpA-like peptidoglycan-associated protein
MKLSKKIFVFTFILNLFSVFYCPSHLYSQLINTVVSLTGSVFDAVTRDPVTAYIIVADENDKKINATRSNSYENGYYYVTGLRPGKKYYVTLSKPNYFKEKYEIQLANTDKYQEISKDFLVKPMDRGVRIPLPVPPFELNKTKIRFGADDILESFLSTLLNNPNVKFEIDCYPDNDDNKKDNLKFTEDRCKSLMAYFISKGVEPARITSKGSNTTDSKNPPPKTKRAKGKRYVGSTYIVVKDF